jgi:glycosyltransferase involved in cell wall biosynthesis
VKPANTPGRKLTGVSAVFPAMNDGGTIGGLVTAARTALRDAAGEFEIIVVDNGSRDDSGRILDDLARSVPELRVIRRRRPLGYGGAVRAGFAAATQEWIFYTDGDAQYNPLELGKLAAGAADGIDAVNGYKTGRRDPWHRILLGRLYHHAVRRFFGIRLRDVDCDFRLFRRALLDRVSLESTTGTLGVELVKRFQDAGCVFAEVPVSHYPRRYGGSQFFRPGPLLATARQLASLWIHLVLFKDRP